MTLATARILILDSATISNVSRDYWGPERSSREKARAFVARLQDLGVFVTFTLTHVMELLRHENERVVRDRLRFLRSLPLIAWLRPYDHTWFPGGIPDLLLRELHAVVHGSARNWRAIVGAVRPELWETGVGSDMFVDNDELWLPLKRQSERQHEIDKYVASVARTDPAHLKDVKLSDALRLPQRPKEQRAAYMRRFAREMQKQLDRHGDRRFDRSREAAIDFARGVLRDIRAIEEIGGDLLQRVLESSDVPPESMSAEMTVGELGELAVWAKQLEMLAARLRRPVKLTMRDVPQDTLPSHVLQRRLASIQTRAERVSGSDLGDAYIAPLVFYADSVQVDKRTYEFLNRVRRNERRLDSLMRRFFRSSDYSQIADHCEQ